MSEKKCLLAGTLFLEEESALLNGVWCLSQIIYKSFGGENYPGRKGLHFGMVCYIQVFWRENCP